MRVTIENECANCKKAIPAVLEKCPYCGEANDKNHFQWVCGWMPVINPTLYKWGWSALLFVSLLALWISYR